MTRPPGSSRAKKDPSERGRGVFCKNCPFPSRALPIPEKTFLPVWPEGPRRCLKDSESLPVKMGNNSSHQNDKNKKQQGARCIRSEYNTVPPVRIFQVNHTGDPGSPPETSSKGIPLALPDSIILSDKAHWEGEGGTLVRQPATEWRPLGAVPVTTKEATGIDSRDKVPPSPSRTPYLPPALLTSCRRRRRAANMPSSQGWSWGVCHCTRRSRLLSSASSQSTACSFSSGCRVQVM